MGPHRVKLEDRNFPSFLTNGLDYL
ncbi:uncharacterized protein METZ01_LOCUS322922, partial [marine metagenome]